MTVSEATTETPAASVLIVIVNYRSANLTVDCLRSLATEVAAVPGAHVVVTDNASGDGSVSILQSAVESNGWRGWVTLMPLERNGGFAYGNNAAIRQALASSDPPKYVWLLNPDTIVHPGALSTLVTFLDSRPDVGLAGSRLENPDGSAQRSWFCFPSVAGEIEGAARLRLVSKLCRKWVGTNDPPQSPCQVDWVAGASLLVRREVFDAVGLLDEAYFMYFEEVDFCRKAFRAGWPCWYVPESRVIHLVGQISGFANLNEVSSRRRPRYWFQARRYYFLKNLGAVKTLIADLAFALAFLQFRIRYALLGRPVVESKMFLWDFVRYNLLPPTFKRPLP